MKRQGWMAGSVAVMACANASATIYSVVPSDDSVTPGSAIAVSITARTEVGDNLVDFGHFSFAIDLLFTGTSGVDAGATSDVTLLSPTLFNDVNNNRIGSVLGADLIGTAGVSTDAIAPNAGSEVDELVDLIRFVLTIPLDTPIGSTIVISPREGFLENLTVRDDFDSVSPQNFAPATIAIIPEPVAMPLLLLAMFKLRRQ